MKKLLISIASAALLSSCGGKSAEDLNVEDIKVACDCTDAVVLVTEDIFSFLASKGVYEPYAMNIDKLSDEDHETISNKSRKLEEIMEHCVGIGVERLDIENCESFSKAMANMEKIEK